MSITTKGFHLRDGGTTLTTVPTTWTRISANNENLCIKDFPDMDNADPDQVETTTLCDSAHEFIDGLDNYQDYLEFTANLDVNLMDEVNNNHSTERWWALQLGGGDNTAGTYPIWYFKGKAKCILVGAGVGDAAEMRIRIKPTSSIEKGTYTIS